MSAPPTVPAPSSGRRRAPGPPPPATPPAAPPAPLSDSGSEVVRWAAFSCVLVPVVLVVYGTGFTPALLAALGLAAVTVSVRLLLLRSERTAAQIAAEQSAPHRGRHGRTGSGAHRGGRHAGEHAPEG
ncbi:hypothetical protein [Streptomyces sp. NPDC050738]|uniref:hypothetical protein n=1 Tax=Streptomyces sp. NPDC050738 TaxID=3154744 RepID=UPI003445F39F